MYGFTVIEVMVITQDEYDILVCYYMEAKLRMSINNKDIIRIRMYLGYNWLITQRTLPINASFVTSNLASDYVHL